MGIGPFQGFHGQFGGDPKLVKGFGGKFGEVRSVLNEAVAVFRMPLKLSMDAFPGAMDPHSRHSAQTHAGAETGA